MNNITVRENRENTGRQQAAENKERAASFSVNFEDRKYTVHDMGKFKKPLMWKGNYYVPKEDIYSIDDGVSLARAKESVKVLKKGYTRLHPLRVLTALLLSPVFTLIGSVLRFFSHFYVCIPCAAASAYAYLAMGVYAKHWRYMDMNAISTPISFLFIPIICRLILPLWKGFMGVISFPVIINDATRDKVISVQEKWIELLNRRMELGEKNGGSFVSLPDIDHYDKITTSKSDWLTLYDTGYLDYKDGKGALADMSTPPVTLYGSRMTYDPGEETVYAGHYKIPGLPFDAVLSDKLVNGSRTLLAAKRPVAEITDLKFLTDESVNLFAGAANFVESQKAALACSAYLPYEPLRDSIADRAAAFLVSDVDYVMRQVHLSDGSRNSAALIDRAVIDAKDLPGVPEAARMVYDSVMNGNVDEELGRLMKDIDRDTRGIAREDGFTGDVKRLAGKSLTPAQKRWKEGIAAGRKLAADEFLADYERFDEIIRSRKADGVPAGNADTGARITESAAVINFIGRVEKALGHRGFLQDATTESNWDYIERRYAPKVAGSHFWNGKYHTVTDLQMKKSSEGMKILRKLGMTPKELKMSDEEFEEYITKKFKDEFEDAKDTPALGKTIYRRYSRRYHPDAAPAQFKERFETAFRILGEEYAKVKQ